MFHEQMKEKAIGSLVGLLKACHRNISPIIVIMPTDIISVLQGASLHKYTRDCTNHTCFPILAPAVKSCSSSPRKSRSGKCKIILLMSNGRARERSRPCLQMSNEGRETKNKKKNIRLLLFEQVRLLVKALVSND